MPQFSFSTIIVLLGATVTSVVQATALTTVTPCPSCPSSMAPSPMEVTRQFQPVSTCVPSSCEEGDSKCSVTTSCSNYEYVSTVCPVHASGTTGSTKVTSASQVVTFANYHATITSTSTARPSPAVPYGNSTQSHQTEVHTIQHMCPYHEMGPIAMSGYGGSGVCDECESEDSGAPQQIVTVRDCVNAKCSSHIETWVSTRGSVTTVVATTAPATVTATASNDAQSTATAAACDSYVLQMFRANTALLKAPLGYVKFSGNDALQVTSAKEAVPLTLQGGQLVTHDGMYIGTTISGFAVLEKFSTIPKTSAKWSLTSPGSEIKYSDASFSMADGSASFCLGSDYTVFGQYTSAAPKCKPIKLVAQCAPSSSSSSSSSGGNAGPAATAQNGGSQAGSGSSGSSGSGSSGPGSSSGSGASSPYGSGGADKGTESNNSPGSGSAPGSSGQSSGSPSSDQGGVGGQMPPKIYPTMSRYWNTTTSRMSYTSTPATPMSMPPSSPTSVGYGSASSSTPGSASAYSMSSSGPASPTPTTYASATVTSHATQTYATSQAPNPSDDMSQEPTGTANPSDDMDVEPTPGPYAHYAKMRRQNLFRGRNGLLRRS